MIFRILIPLVIFVTSALGKFAEPKIEELQEVLQGAPVIIWNLRFVLTLSDCHNLTRNRLSYHYHLILKWKI